MEISEDHPLHDTVVMLLAEFGRSMVKHPEEGDWTGRTYTFMEDKLKEELDELWIAHFRDDMEGEHGMKSEAIQVVNCAAKLHAELYRRTAPVPFDKEVV